MALVNGLAQDAVEALNEGGGSLSGTPSMSSA